jgi:hypothetical protein
VSKHKYLPLASDDERHGTDGGYTNQKCRCQPCRAGHAKAQREANRRRSERPIPGHVHGSINGYRNYLCRCEKCLEAKRIVSREQYRRRYSAEARGSKWSVECKRGHKRTPENTYQRKDGRTMCRPCILDRQRSYRAIARGTE